MCRSPTMEGRIGRRRGGHAPHGARRRDRRGPAAAVLADFSARFGRVRGGGMVVVALGKAGGREMMAGSDLDLMLIYDHPDEVTESPGARRLPASQ